MEAHPSYRQAGCGIEGHIGGRFIWGFHSVMHNLGDSYSIGRGEEAPTPTLSVLLRKPPVLLRADFVLTKDPKWPYEGPLFQ